MFSSGCERSREGEKGKGKKEGGRKVEKGRERERGRKGEGCFNIKFGELFMLILHFLCSLYDSNPLLLTSVIKIK